MELRKLVGKNVRQLRLRRGWSQEHLAFEAGLDRTYVSGVERGVRNPTLVIVGRLAKAFKVTPDLLLRRE
jgi:transcriptional regulator with XRE-family HTH domain